MPRANWGIETGTIDDFDRESQYAPYTGPIPPAGSGTVYQWKIKVAKSISATRDKLPQLRIGLELAPRAEYDEKRYKGFFAMAFIPVSDKTAFRYVPFLDAIGVSSTDFTRRTITDEEGNIKRIGAWKNDGTTLILAELKDEQDNDGNPRKGIGWIGPADSTVDYEEEEEYDVDDSEEEEYEEEAPPPKRRSNSTPPRRGRVSETRSRRKAEEDWD